MISDVPGWAWDNNVKALIKYLPEYHIDQVFVKRCNKPVNKFHISMIDNYDHVHSFGWSLVTRYSQHVSAGVCSHNYELRREGGETYFPKYKALVANSKILYDKIRPYNPKVYYFPNGVHQDVFLPVKKSRNKKFVVGWLGQKTEGSFNLDCNPKIDIKGYQNVLLPLMERLNDKEVVFKIIDNNYMNGIDHSDMPKYFEDVDVQICTSFREGTPNPMFEAASCGKPLISTRVGAISDFIDESGGGIIIDAYDSELDIMKTIDSFEKSILFLKENRCLCDQMGELNRKHIELNWSWEKISKKWITLFEDMINNKM